MHSVFLIKHLQQWRDHPGRLLPVVAASREAAGDAGPSKGCGAGVVAHVVPLGGAHAAALHVAPADTEAQARQATDTRSISEAGIVEPSLCHRGCVCGEKEKQEM